MLKINLAELALKKGHTKTSLHFESGLSYPTILRYWNGEVKQFDGEVIETLCKFLKCDLCDLIEIIDDSTSTDVPANSDNVSN